MSANHEVQVLPVQFPATTGIFWQDIRRIASAARSLITRDDNILREAPFHIYQELRLDTEERRSITERILTYTGHLMDLRTRPTTRATNVTEQSILMKTWLTESKNALDLDPCITHNENRDLPLTIHDDFEERRDEILMETLTAGWLALYFLGMPFIHPWERVRRMAQDRGGFPSGACVNKYVGDIFRATRKHMMTDRNFAADPNNVEIMKVHATSQVMVLSFSPMAILEGLIDVNDDNRTPSSAHLLGRCYAMLQMRLYLNAGLPIRYFVSIESLRRSWEKIKNLYPTHNYSLEDIRKWVRTVFPYNMETQAVYALEESAEISGTPTCVLGPEVGVYVIDTTKFNVPFAGNNVVRLLLQSYRSKLAALEPDRMTGQVLNLQDAASYQPLRERLAI